MTGPEHYKEAERLIAPGVYDEDGEEEMYKRDIARAQVHATLALAAAVALKDSDGGMSNRDYYAWIAVAGGNS